MRRFKENNDIRPAAWATSYGLYNEGELYGKWFFFDNYSSYEDMVDAIVEYLEPEDSDPEIMIADTEYIPRGIYQEAGLSEEMFDFAKFIEDRDEETYEAVEAFLNLGYAWDEDKFTERYVGKFDTLQDIGYYIVENGLLGVEIPESLEMYIDYEAIGRDYSINGSYVDGFLFWA